MGKRCIFWEARAPSERASAPGSFCSHREDVEGPSCSGAVLLDPRKAGTERQGGQALLPPLPTSSQLGSPSSQRRRQALCCCIPWGAICLSHLSLGFSFEQIPPSQWSWPDGPDGGAAVHQHLDTLLNIPSCLEAPSLYEVRLCKVSPHR